MLLPIEDLVGAGIGPWSRTLPLAYPGFALGFALLSFGLPGVSILGLRPMRDPQIYTTVRGVRQGLAPTTVEKIIHVKY